MRSKAPLEVLGLGLHPAEQRGAVHRDAAVGQHEREVAVADREGRVPAQRPQDHLGGEVPVAPLRDVAGTCIPTLYAGRTREAAAFETIFRDLPPLPLSRQVFTRSITGTALGELRTRRPLRLAALFNQNLALIGKSRQTIVECHGTAAYAETARWAEAIHRDLPGLDGLLWTSRQQDEALAMLLFGTRVGPTTWRSSHPSRSTAVRAGSRSPASREPTRST